MRKKEIMPMVIIYRDVFKDINKAMSIIKNLEKEENKNILPWESWKDFGIISHLYQSKNLPINEFKNNLNSDQKMQFENLIWLCDNVFNAFYECYDDYIKNYVNSDFIKNLNEKSKRDPFSIPPFGGYVNNWDYKNNLEEKENQWMETTIDLIKYNSDYDNTYILQYHVDDGKGKEDPGPHSILSCLLYFNDDYQNGKISFLNEFDDKIINYKPKAGDITILPSGKPFFHAAFPANNNNKYFARQFLTWNYSGSKQWHENNNKFGKKAWKEIQKYIRKIEEEFGVYTKDVIFPGEIYKNMGRHNGKPFIAKEVVEFDNEW